MSFLRSTSSWPTRCRTWPRMGAGVLDHCAKPRLAEAIARFKSSGPERGNRPITSFQSAGLRFSKYSPVEGTTQSPAMKFLKSMAFTVRDRRMERGSYRRRAGMGRPRPRHSRDPNPRRDRYRRHAAAERRIRLGQFREQLVHLSHLAIPIALFGILVFRHYAAPPPSPPRANPYRSIFL